MNRSTHLEHAATGLLRDALEGYAEATVESETNVPGQRADLVLNIEGKSMEPARLVLELKGDAAVDEHPDEVTVVQILEDAAPKLRDQLRAEGKSYIDTAGAVHLRLPGVMIDRTDLPAVSIHDTSAATRSPFADRASQVPRALLSSPQDETWTVSELADAASVPYSTAWYATKALEERRLLTVTKEGNKNRISVNDPKDLIRDWTTRYSWSKNRQFQYQVPIGDVNRFLKRLHKAIPNHLRWGLTLQAGAHLVAPHATWDHIHLYLDVETKRELLELGSDLGDDSADDGRLTLLLPYYQESVWTDLQKIQDLPVVSTLQLVLDLWHYPVRGREQAEHLIDTVLAPIWHG